MPPSTDAGWVVWVAELVEARAGGKHAGLHLPSAGALCWLSLSKPGSFNPPVDYRQVFSGFRLHGCSGGGVADAAVG